MSPTTFSAGMETTGSKILENDDGETTMKDLVNGFGSVISREDKAYMQGSTSNSTNFTFNGEVLKGVESSESSYGNVSEKLVRVNGSSRTSRQKWRPAASVGTVSSVIGKNYVRSTQLANGSSMATKPLKLDSRDFPESELWGEETESNASKDNPMKKDMEDFLLKMLGDGFQLDREVIGELLDTCGYDMQKSRDTRPKSKVLSDKHKLSHGNVASNTDRVEIPGQQKERNDLQKEILAALFNASERFEELPTKTVRVTKRSLALGEVVAGPPLDFTPEHKNDEMSLQQDTEVRDADEEDGYQGLRKAVKEYRGTMKEYYKAAFVAFSEGDHVRAAKLLDEGQFFQQRAREADEESSQRIFETRNVDTQNEMLLDLHDHDAKEAIRLLKCHLSSLSGIPSIKYLKVIIETNDEDTSKGARRRMVMKLLEKDSIKWTEEGKAGTIVIQLDEINPKRLSFAKK